MPDTILRVEDTDRVRVLTLHRPHVKNALDMPLRYQLADAVAAAMSDDQVGAVVITGAGGAFCAGGDISAMEPMSPEEARRRIEAAQRIVREIWRGTKPVVAAVDGPAFGAGLALALACDRVVASTGASFGAAFVHVGLAGDLGISWSLPERLGAARARQFLMMGERVDADAGARLGLVDAVADAGSALAAAIDDAGRLAARAPLALAAIRELLRRCPEDREAALRREVDAAVSLLASADLAEGVAAYRERRTPIFQGR